MDAREIRALLPLAKGSLKDFRLEVRSQICMSAIRRLADKAITPELLKTTIMEMFGFKDCPIEVVVNDLELLSSRRILRKKEDHYTIIKLPEHRGYDELKNRLALAFTAELRSRDKHYDVYDYRGWEGAIDKSILNLSIAMQSLISEAESPGGTLSAEATRTAILDPWMGGSEKLAKAGEYFLDYLQSESPVATYMLTAIYETCLTVNMLSRGQKLEGVLENAPPPDKVFLDTNCLLAILCPSNKYHDVVISTVRLAKRFSFDVGYIRLTEGELDSLIRSADRIIQAGDVVDGAARNEIVLDFTRRKPSGKWSERVSDLLLWPEWLDSKYGVKKIAYDVPSTTDVERETFRETLQIILRSQYDWRDSQVVSHDVLLYEFVQARRKNVSGLFKSPLIETLDRSFLETDTLLVRLQGFPKAVMHATQWLNMLSQFVDVTFEEGDIKKVAHGILRNLVEPFKQSLTIDEYARLLTARHEWEPEEADFVARLLTESIYRSELERSLREINADEAAKVTQRILEDGKLIEAVIGRREADSKVTEYQTRMRQMGQAMIVDRKIIQYVGQSLPQSILSAPELPGVSRRVTAVIHGLVAEMKEALPELTRSEGVEELLLTLSSKDEVKKALGKIQATLHLANMSDVSVKELLAAVDRIRELVDLGW